MTPRHLLGLLAVFVLLPACAPRATAAAQAAPAPAVTRAPDAPAPTLVVSASAEVELAPDRAGLSVAVETRGNSAAEAAAANARTQTAIIEAIKRAGVAAPQVRTSALAVQPEYQYPERGGRPTVVGYQARNSVEVEVRDLTRIGAIIDAALGAGATNIVGPNFGVADPSNARRAALELAVRKARADAEAAAVAAGARLGIVLELQLTDDQPMPMQDVRFRTMAAAAESTPVETGTLKVRAAVVVRYQLLQP